MMMIVSMFTLAVDCPGDVEDWLEVSELCVEVVLGL